MNKTELIRAFADKVIIQKKQATELVETLMEIMMNTLSTGEEIKLLGFGTFKLIKVKAKTVINPKNKTKIQIDEYTRLKFVPGKNLKDAINNRD
jgi:DNA-binding protein HU-beta